MRGEKALKSVATSLLLQAVTIICGFIVPKFIMETYGSEVNGMVSSISQFLSCIVLLEAGVGGVAKAALYKPLGQNNIYQISAVVKAVEKFFRTVAVIFLGYMAALAFAYPVLVNKSFDMMFTASLVIIIGASTFMQYYFGLSYQVLLQADQKRYITANIQTVTVILNAILVVLLVKSGQSIHIVKFGSAIIYMLRPLCINLYVKKKYKLDRSAKPDNTAISQRWDGLGHHIAHFLHTNTDVIVLTVFSGISKTVTIAEVSVYTVYYSIVAGIEKITSTFSSGIEAAFGNMIANDEREALNRNFGYYEFVSFIITTILFTSAAMLILPFVAIYTQNIKDTNYIRPAFAFILTAAEAVYCLRIPYNSVTLAAGHYKQTRNGAFAEAGINLVLSTVLVVFFGINGVAVATLAAMTFRTVQYVMHLSKNILNRSTLIFFKRLAINACASAVSILLIKLLPNFAGSSFLMWLVYAFVVTLICSALTFTVNIIFYMSDFRGVLLLLKGIVNERKSKKGC